MRSPEAPPTAGRRTVGVWSWETDVIPDGWREAANGLDEVWTYSPFSSALIEAGIGSRVQSIPPPISTPSPPSGASLDLPRGFRVLVMFDFLSTLERKNPLGAVAAFRSAFDPNDGAVLILKSMNGRHRPARRAELIDALAGRPDIVLLDRTMTAPERDALVADCDCLLSMHRSEGHGLHIAEAMAAGKPVIATAFGGNTQFMSDRNSYPLSWRPARVGPAVEHYPPDASWAEPDIDAARRVLRFVYNNRADAALRGARGRDDVLTMLSPEAVGSSMVARFCQSEKRRRPWARLASANPKRRGWIRRARRGILDTLKTSPGK